MVSRKSISKEIEIEDLVREFPESVNYLMDKGIRCLRCGEPIWGSLEKASLEKGFSRSDIEVFVKEINKMIANKYNMNVQ